jgi:hypothetical protein
VVSNVNFLPGQFAVPNRVIVPVSSAGQIDLVSDVATDVVVDVNGYFTAAGGSGALSSAERTPARIADTRCPGSNPPSFCAGEQIPATNSSLSTVGSGRTITVQVTGNANVPAGATAVVVNVTVTDTSGAGYLTVYPGTTRPTASDLNWTAGETVANLTDATLGSTGTITIYNYTGSTDVIVDVLGWYE